MPAFENAPRNWPTPTQDVGYYVTLTITRTFETYTTTILLSETVVPTSGETVIPNTPATQAVAIDDGLSALTVGIVIATIIGAFILLLLLCCCCYPRLRRRRRRRYSSSYTTGSTGSYTSSSLPTTAGVSEPLDPARPPLMRPVVRPDRPLRPPIPVPTLRPLQFPRPAYTRGFFR